MQHRSIIMYVCLCEGINESTIKNAVLKGCNTVKAIRDKTGAAKNCCKCVEEIQNIIKTTTVEKNIPLFHSA